MTLIATITLFVNLIYGGEVFIKHDAAPSLKEMELQLDLFLEDEEVNIFSLLLHSHLESFIENKSSESDVKLLRKLFYRTHTKILKRYEQYVPLSKANPNYGGYFDCLTATALFAIMLDRLGYNYTIHELEFHVYLTVEVSGQTVLIETTDPFSGFETNDAKISERISSYRSSMSIDQFNSITSDEEVKQVNLMPEINNTITLEQLAGLHYYNLAVKAFNSMDFGLAKFHLEKAKALYDCPRVSGLLDITIVNLSEGVSMR